MIEVRITMTDEVIGTKLGMDPHVLTLQYPDTNPGAAPNAKEVMDALEYEPGEYTIETRVVHKGGDQ